MILFQILASFFILFAINRIIRRYHEERIPKSEIMVWLILWVIVAVAVWWPRGTDILANWLGISRGYELIVAVSLALLFFLMFKVFSHIHRLERQATKLVRKLAIKEYEIEHQRESDDSSRNQSDNEGEL